MITGIATTTLLKSEKSTQAVSSPKYSKEEGTLAIERDG
jgi:hypothetical protein